VLAIGTFMVLDQLNIAPQIVTITYASLMGMLALAGALAFGLGGRDGAGRMLESAYETGQASKDQIRRDVQQGTVRAQDQAQQKAGRFEHDGQGAVSSSGQRL